MNESEYAARIANVRARFASKLVDKIAETEAALTQLTGGGSDAVEAVAAAYRRFHDVCGIGGSIGFQATGQSARILDTILLEAFRDHRALSEDELAKLTAGLKTLQIVARNEIQSMEPAS